jgi:hypothetical protein
VTFDAKALLDFWTPERRAEVQAAWFPWAEKRMTLAEKSAAHRLDGDEREAIEWEGSRGARGADLSGPWG